MKMLSVSNPKDERLTRNLSLLLMIRFLEVVCWLKDGCSGRTRRLYRKRSKSRVIHLRK